MATTERRPDWHDLPREEVLAYVGDLTIARQLDHPGPLKGCGLCGAVVHAATAQLHEDWHITLQRGSAV